MAREERRQSGRHDGNSKRVWLVGITLLVVIGVIVAVVAFRPQPDVGGTVDKFNLEVQPALGSPDAPVKLVEFGDFKCPYCARFETEVFSRIRSEYVDTGRVQAFFINIPFIAPDSYTAALAAETITALYPEHFWDFYTVLYDAQGPETQAWATPDRLADIAEQVVPNFDRQRFLKAVNNQLYKTQVEDDVAIAQAVGVHSTPAVYVNGEPVDDWGYESVKKAIDEKLQ